MIYDLIYHKIMGGCLISNIQATCQAQRD